LAKAILTRFILITLWLESEDNVKNFIRSMTSNADVVRELLSFLWKRKLWWLIPMVTVLLLFGLLLIFASASGVGPFIYTLF
jgi:hypothetical protein